MVIRYVQIKRNGGENMRKLGDYLASQCGNPHGVIGKIMTWAMNHANNVMYKGIVDELKISPKTKILDVGFGNGYLEKLIIRKSPCSITGIDISEDIRQPKRIVSMLLREI